MPTPGGGCNEESPCSPEGENISTCLPLLNAAALRYLAMSSSFAMLYKWMFEIYWGERGGKGVKEASYYIVAVITIGQIICFF